MALPLKYLAKLGAYKVEVHCTTVTVRIAEHVDLVDTGLKDLKENMVSCDVVGLDVKDTGEYTPKTLLLCAKSYCLVIRLQHLKSVPESLNEFLVDPEICFVGVDMDKSLAELRKWGLKTNNGVGIGELIGRIYKASPPSVEPSKVEFNIDAPSFSSAQISLLIQDVHISFLTGKQMLGSL